MATESVVSDAVMKIKKGRMFNNSNYELHSYFKGKIH
jgi:hypothetical protein